MSEISIDTLKTMLANLDDAKKYQRLRDVMETLPAPDLAAVFEDLPAEKLPVLFRLCPKDLAADVFTELTPATQQKLIDGLTDTELKAVVDELFVDDATDLVEEMPANVVKRILGQADPTTRRKINELRNKPTLTAKEEDLLVTLEAVYEFNLRGFEFAPMSLYESDATKFLIRDGKLLPPFVAISGLGDSPDWNLMACRAGGREFVSVEGLSAASPEVGRTHREQLRAMGALGEMPDSSQMSLF